MLKKLHIEARRTPSRFLPVARLVAFERDGCLGCLKCVKRSSCVYDSYRKRSFDPERVEDSIDALCLGCMRCVQECKKGILSRAPNPILKKIGDDYWTPDLLLSLWKQAETGAIPVSGAGYRGPFTGPGWDSMWTDMSEIVRPTRDGIHGREYISTSVDLGSKPDILSFDERGHLVAEDHRMLEIPLPIVFEIPWRGCLSDQVRIAMALAARRIGTLMVATLEEARGPLAPYVDRLIVGIEPGEESRGATRTLLSKVPAAEIAWTEDAISTAAALRDRHPRLMVSVRVPFDEKAGERAAALARAGVGIIHLAADPHGNGLGAHRGRFARDLIREVHVRLVEERLRDRVTLVVRGGIAMPEHMAKAIACGADAVGVGAALMIALECRMCGNCEEGFACPVRMEEVEPAWAERRIANLIGSWHNQLLEVLGAMGIREARRLRGEVGRVMFFEDLERECFGPVFGQRKRAARGEEGAKERALDAG